MFLGRFESAKLPRDHELTTNEPRCAV